MEMTFPHRESGQRTVNGRADYQAMLAIATARQTNSRTVQAMLIAGRTNHDSPSAKGDNVEQRIHYFGSRLGSGQAPSGAFWSAHRTQDTGQAKYESSVYQNASTNIKAHDVNSDWTGEQFNQTGHGASRTL
jgi:hypothetical protein